MTDGWAGFRATPKPLTGVTVENTSRAFQTPMVAARVISLLTTSLGLSSWLGEVAILKLGVGAKVNVDLDGQKVELLYTCLDFPGHIVFMTEGLGELDFKLTESKNGTKILVAIRRAVTPAELPAWATLTSEILQRFESVASHA